MSEKKKFELTPSISIILAGIIIAGAIIFVNRNPSNTQAAAAANAPVGTPTPLTIRPPSSSDHIIGSPNAPIVLVEYSDFQCPFCQMIYPEIKDIVAKSGGQVAWVQRELPLVSIHPNAGPAANAAECIAALGGNDDYWKFADTVFADQSKLSDSYYASLASQFGIDSSKFATCYSSKQYQSVIDKDTNEAEGAGGNGTPFTVVVDTQTGKMVPISGAVPEAQIQSVINSLK